MPKSPTAKNASILPCFAVAEDVSKQDPTTTLLLTSASDLAGGKLRDVSQQDIAQARANGFEGKSGQFFLFPQTNALAGANDTPTLWDIAAGPVKLPNGLYLLQDFLAKKPLAATDEKKLEQLALGWALGAYSFDTYKTSSGKKKSPRLVLPRDLALRVSAAASAHYLARDLINTPAADLTPEKLCEAGAALAARHGAKSHQITGSDLEKNFPAIHTVGKAATAKPALFELNWGNPGHPEVVLIGKGITFDSGGLDIKSTDGMLDMKKDMGGAATVLALADRIMQEKLPIRLRVLIPTAENAIAGNAFRPRDIIRTRSGKTVEVTNTDAEGRLVLCDALTYACESKKAPALIIDFATLTGAARVALGPELPALFSNDERLAKDLLSASQKTADPMWQLPLWAGYDSLLESKNADLINSANSSFAGAITAALFLQNFVPANVPWAHIDTFSWTKNAKPGRPEGGEPLTMRAVLYMLQKRFTP